EPGNQLWDRGQVGEVEPEGLDVLQGLRKILVEAEHLHPRLHQRRGSRPADAAAGAGDQRRLHTEARPGMSKPAARSSVMSVSSCCAVSSTSGGRQVFHSRSLPKCATAAL